MADSLTDEQLVEELQSYGETVTMPIKPNKRPILIKKLNHFRSRNRQQQQKGKGKQPVQRPPRLNLESFSSDDSDAEATTSASFPAQSHAQSQVNKRPLQSSASKKITEIVTRSLRHRPNVSPPSVAVRGRRTPDPIDRTGSLSRPGSGMTLSQRRRRDVTPIDDEVSPDGSNYRLPDISALSHGSTSRDTASFSDRSTIPFESSDSDIEGSSYEVENKSVNTTFSLTGGRRSPTSNHVSPNRHFYSTRSSTESETNHTPSRSSPLSRGRPRRRFYPEHVSFGLVALVLAFFVIIFFGYMFVRKELFMGWFFTDQSAQADKDYMLCSDENKEYSDCYSKKEADKATAVIRDLYISLSTRKGNVLCGYADESEQRLTAEGFLSDLKQKHGVPESLNVERLYNYSIELIIRHPQWNLRVFTKDGNKATSVSEVAYLESAVASLGLWCRFCRSFSRVMWQLFLLIAGTVGLGLVLLLLYWRIQAKEKEEQRVFAMVEQIIDLLKEQHEFVLNEDTNEQAGLAVQHVRDQLLPPARRKAMQRIWDKAVKFIEANESRVRLETQIIEGEEFAVWRWIQTVPNGGKVWQGQAFGEHNENSTATAVYSPTPCLKIRNMFDKELESGENWEESVKDGLLEKCQDIKSLVHIYVDKNSKEGCVYVKCNSKEAAGKVRQALHGWWFDGRLVTVKHLKVEHYHHRWPEAKFAWRPLQPSTNQMRSLAQPYHRSTLEMT